MSDQRTSWIILIVIIIVSLWGVLLLSVLLGQTSTVFFLGIPIGIFFGIGTGMYFAETWDAKRLRPTGYRNKKIEFVIAFIIIISGTIAKTFADVLDGKILDLMLGALLGWVSYTLGYFVLQAYRKRSK